MSMPASPSPVLSVQGVPVYEVVGMFVYESTEGEAVPPAGVHVDDVDILVGVRHPTTPDLRKTFL